MMMEAMTRFSNSAGHPGAKPNKFYVAQKPRIFAVVLMVLALAIGQNAYAQSTGSPSSAGYEGGADAGEKPRPQLVRRSSLVEEIVVTATKRETDLRDIPLSIDAFTGESLREIGAVDVESIARFSPGVSVSPGLDPEAAQVIIRGVSTDTFFTFFTRTFGMFYEDVSMVNPSILGPQPNVDPFDMKTVEILKGPQGTLFGGSALAGAIRYVPNKPDFEEIYGQIKSN